MKAYFGEQMNPHILLGVPPTATFEELKRAYRHAVLRYHPDSARGKGDPEKLNAVLQAYQLLKAKYETCGNWSTKPTAPPRPAPRYQPPKPAAHMEIDAMTAQMSIEELIQILEFSNNPHVHKTAMKALALKQDSLIQDHLSDLLNRVSPAIQCQLIRLIRETNFIRAGATIFQGIQHSNLDIAVETIKSLESLNIGNRNRILQSLQTDQSNLWQKVFTPVKSNLQRLQFRKGANKSLGGILLNHDHLSQEQLELALLLQKKHPILLGSLLKKLGYISSHEIQEALSLQKQL